MLTITLPEELAAALRAMLPGRMEIDLPAQRLRFPDGSEHGFEIDAFRKRCLVQGLDDIGLTLEHADRIAAFQQHDRAARPWAIPA